MVCITEDKQLQLAVQGLFTWLWPSSRNSRSVNFKWNALLLCCKGMRKTSVWHLHQCLHFPFFLTAVMSSVIAPWMQKDCKGLSQDGSAMTTWASD